ncbi:MAG: ATP-binding protein, partial [Acidobacteriia bacterium]|nr:ATP-binding protein [Terriglobia bacterium]
HPRVTGNSATKVLGRTDSAELGESGYRFLDKDIKMHLTRLEPGSLIMSHPIYRQPVKIKFPRPAFKQGR